MKRHKSQCLVCSRERVEKWSLGTKTTDVIVPTVYSDWIDTFVSPNHSHVWLVHTSYNRRYWFGSTSVGCGGVATVRRIFEQRSLLGEQEARRLIAKWHGLVKAPTFDAMNLKVMDEFTQRVVSEPQSLLEDG